MHTVIKAILTAALVVAIAWPLLFWGNPGASQHNGSNIQRQLPPVPPFTFRPPDYLLW
jgi:hypothetical protein